MSVLARGPRGARLRVEEGEARFDVAHLPHAAWSVEAGPYVVYVTGTVFDVRWSGSDEVIEVRMRSGSVQVGGPLLPERVTLRAGQRLRARLASSELLIGDARVGDVRGAAVDVAPVRPQARRKRPAMPGRTATPPRAGRAPAAGDAPAAAAALPLPAPLVRAAGGRCPAGAAARARPRRSRRRRRSARLRRSRTARTPHVNQNPSPGRRARGPARSPRATRPASSPRRRRTASRRRLLEVDSTALMALSDASRYSGRPEVAVRALVAERQRFPDTTFAHAAAFLLGKLADDRGEVAAGLAWYRRYLSETPDGPYAAEALGRKMLAIERISGRDAARSIASEYVERFPNGTYMLQAHAILANPTP